MSKTDRRQNHNNSNKHDDFESVHDEMYTHIQKEALIMLELHQLFKDLSICFYKTFCCIIVREYSSRILK